MEHLRIHLPPGDPSLIDSIVSHLKSQGIFDEFRHDCLADVDTKPSYQNLSQRVDGYVSKFLSNEIWDPNQNKNELRNKLRRQIDESGMLALGVDHVVEQVVNAKTYHVFLPKIVEVVHQYLGIKTYPYNEKESILGKRIETTKDELTTGDNSRISPTQGLKSSAPVSITSTSSISSSVFNPTGSAVSWENTTLESLIKTEIGVKKAESKCPTEDLFPVKVYSKLGENLELVPCDSQDLKPKSDSGKLPNKTNELKLAHFKAGADNFKNKSENSKDVKLEKVDHCVSKHKQLDKKKEKSFEDIKPKVSDINLSSVVNSEIVIGLNTLESQDSKFKGDFKNDGKTNELKTQNVKNIGVNSMSKSETSKDLKSESTEQSVAKCMPFEKKKDLLHLQTKSKSSDVCLSSKDKSANSLESISFESEVMKQKANLKENLGKTNNSKFSSKISSESSKVKSECDKSTKFEKVEPSATKHKKKDKKKDKSFEETKSKLSETRLLPKDKNMNLEKNKCSNTLQKEKSKSKISEIDKVKLKPKNQSSEKCQTHKSKTSTSDTHKSDVKVINKNLPHLKHSTEKSKTSLAANKLSSTKNKVSLQEQKESSSSTMFKKKKDFGSSDKLNTAIEKTHLSKGSDSQKKKAQATKPYCKADNNPDKHHHTQKGMNNRETKIGSKQDLVSHKDKRIKLNSPSSSPYESSQGSDQERNWSKKASFPQPKKTEKNLIKDSTRKNETKLFDVSAESEASEGGLACGRHSNTLRQVLDNTRGKKISALGSISSETSPAENISTKDSDSSSEGEIFEDTSPRKNKILKSRKRKKKSCKDEKRCDTPPSSPPSPSSSLALLPRHSHTQSPDEDKYKRNSKSDTSKKGNESSARNAKTKEAQLSDISGYQRLESSSEATLFSPTVPEKGSSLRTKDEDLNSQGNMSDVTISSVHTSDLSSFDDGISLSSSDEDMCDKKAVVKKKRKVPLKEASELIKNDESDFSEESEKQSVNSCHSEESGDVEDSHHSDEKTSCDIPALGVEFKRELRRERKLNPKYTSSDYTSIFSHSRDLRSETTETVSRNSCKGNNHSNSEPSEGSIAKKYSSKSKSCAKDLVKVEMPNFVARKRDKHLNSLSEIQAVCESDEELSMQKCKKRNISEVSDSDCQYTISLKIRKVSGQGSGDEIKNNSEKTHSSSESLSDEEESKSYSNKKMASKSNLTESPRKVITKYSTDENIASCSSEVSEHDNKEIVPVTLKSTRNSKKTSKRCTRVSNCDSYSIDKELKGSERKALVSNKSKLGKESPRKSIPRITIHCRAKKEAARRLMRNCYTRPKRYQNGSKQSSSDEEEVSDEKEKSEDQNRLTVKSKGGHCQKRMSKDTNMTDSKQVPGKFETRKESKKVMDLPSSVTLVGRTNNRRRKSKDLSLDQSKCNSTLKSDVQQRSSKWYDSSDLYKPRPVIPSGTRRSRVRIPPAFP